VVYYSLPVHKEFDLKKIIRPGNTEIVCLYLKYLLSIGQHIDSIIIKDWTDWLYRTSGYFDSDRLNFSFGPSLTVFLDQYAESLRGSILILMPISFKALQKISVNHVNSFLDSLSISDIIHSGTFDYNIINKDTNGVPILLVSPYSPLMINQFNTGNMKHLQPNFAPSKIIGYRFPYFFDGCSDYESSLFAQKKIEGELVNLLKTVDSVILSCGCYGAPLSKYCHDNAKNVYYVGGDLQIFFGIMGGRWRPWLENDANYLANKEFWINEVPLEFKFKNRMAIEKSSYW
jgi:hypothetical protein